MSIWKQTASSSKGVEVPPAGAHPAVLVGLFDLGHHDDDVTDEKTGQKRRKEFHKVLLAWELPSEKVSGSSANHVVTKDYNLNFNSKAALRQLIEKWRGKTIPDGEGFDLSVLLGKGCLVTLVHGESNRGNAYAKIDGVTALPKGMAAPQATTKPVAWQIGDGEFPNPDWLPFLYGEPVKDVIARSKEVRGQPVGKASDAPGEPVGAGAGKGEEEVPW